MTKDASINIITASDGFSNLVRPTVERIDAQTDRWTADNYAHVLLDFPLTWALTQLAGMDSVTRARTVVVTQATHPAYHDMLAAFHVSSVVMSDNETSLIAGIYAAASALKVYQWKSGLTYMELRVTRLLVLGYDTNDVAAELKVTRKTINAHISNILTKLGYDSRAQYVAALMTPHYP